MKTNRMKYALLAGIALVITACAEQKKEDTTTVVVQEKVKVKVETVRMQAVSQLGEFTATVEANISNNISPQVPMRIEKIFVEVGDRVKKGQLLASLDETNLKQARMQFQNIEIEFNRIDELYKVGGISKSAWDAQKTQLDVTRNMIGNLEENASLLSPISGIITARNYDSGDMVGQLPIYTVEEIRPVKLKVNISESLYTKVKKGQDVDVRFDVYENEQFKGKISLVYPSIDPITRTFSVEIKIANSDERIKPGMFSRVTMNFGEKNHVVTPDRAVVKQAGAGDRYIYVYKDGKVNYQLVKLGRQMGNTYEVISGVSDGDQVVITGQSRLTNGMEVELDN